MKKPTDGEEVKPEIAKHDDSQPIGAGTWKAEEAAKCPPEEVAPPKPAVRDHHAKAKHEPKHDEAAVKPAPEKADA